MDPLILSALLTGGASVVGAIGNALGVSSNNSTQQALANKQLKANRENQLLAQQFNASQSALQRQFAERMYNRAYVDNSPLMQRSALQMAGLGSSSANPVPSSPVQGDVASITPNKSFDLPNTQPVMFGSYMNDSIRSISDAIKSGSETKRNEFYMSNEAPVMGNYYSSLTASENSLRGLRANLLRAQSTESLAQADAVKIQTDIQRVLADNQVKVDQQKLQSIVQDLAQQAARISNDYAVGMANISVQHEDVQNRFKLGAFANYSAWSQWRAQLSQQDKHFRQDIKEQVRQFDKQFNISLSELGITREEFDKRHGGANVVWDWLGIHPDALLGLAAGYSAARKGKVKTGTIGFTAKPKKTLRQKVYDARHFFNR